MRRQRNTEGRAKYPQHEKGHKKGEGKTQSIRKGIVALLNVFHYCPICDLSF
jgi:hypothetical protein